MSSGRSRFARPPSMAQNGSGCRSGSTQALRAATENNTDFDEQALTRYAMGQLLASVGALASDAAVADSDVRERLRSLLAEHQQRKPPTRAQLVLDHLTLEIRPVR
jgi:hypothetical protein